MVILKEASPRQGSFWLESASAPVYKPFTRSLALSEDLIYLLKALLVGVMSAWAHLRGNVSQSYHLSKIITLAAKMMFAKREGLPIGPYICK
jgi:hypothetical protein